MSKDTRLTATAPCSIKASAQGDDGENKLPTVSIEGYNGGIMTVGSLGPVVIDLSSLRASDTIPIAYDHGTDNLDRILGQTSQVINDGLTLRMDGIIMSASDTAAQVVNLAKNGFKFQASVGVDEFSQTPVRNGETVTVNGQTLDGPFTLIEGGRLNEISILPLGADSTTSATIAASQTKENPEMDKTKETTDERVKAEDTDTAALAEHNRVAAINAIAEDHPEIAKTAIEEGWTVEQTQEAVSNAEASAKESAVKARIKKLEARLAQRDEQDKRPSVPHIAAGKASFTPTPDILAAAVCIRNGMKSAEKSFGAETCNKAHDMRIRSFTELVAAAVATNGQSLNCTRHDTRELIQAAFSTRSFPVLLSNIANKFILEGYGTVETVWEEIANVRPVTDFKANTGVRMVFANLLKEVAKDGNLTHGTIAEESRTIKANTKGLIIGISREDIINDDLNALSEIPSRLGFAAARTFNTDFWKVLNDSAGQFTSARGNTMTGALTLANLKVAEKLFLALKDADGNPWGLAASMLLAGPGSGASARELFVSTNLIGAPADKSPSANIYAGMFKPAISAYADPSAWYLVAPPMAAPLMQVAFLDGRREPFVETADADFSTLGIQMRCYYDYGCAFAEWRGAVRSSGV